MIRRAECPAVLTLTLLLLAPAASAEQVLEYYGFTWESSASGTLIPWLAGNTRHFVGLVDAINSPLGGDLSSREFTLSLSAVQDGPPAPMGTGVDLRGPYTVYQITYGPPVAIDIYEDAARNAAFDPDPPNEKVPDSFLDGTSYLSATASEFVIILNVYFGSGDESGTLEMDLTITGGGHAGDLGGPGAIVHSTHALKSPHASIPPGFSHRLDGQYSVSTSPVAPTTWGHIKALYQ